MNKGDETPSGKWYCCGGGVDEGWDDGLPDRADIKSTIQVHGRTLLLDM